MLDPNQVITVNNNRGNGKPPLTLHGGKADLKLDADSAYCPQWIYTLIFSSFPCKRESSGLVLDPASAGMTHKNKGFMGQNISCVIHY